MQKIALGLSLIVAIMATIIFYSNKSTTYTKIETYPSSKELNNTIKKPIKQTTTLQTKEIAKNISQNTEKHAQAEEPSYQEHTLYEILSIDEATLTTRPRKNIKPIEAISLNPLSDTKINDTLTLPNIEGIDYTIIISSVSTNSDGSISTTGRFEDEGISYTTTITEAKESSYITLSTPQGIYEIETQDGIGYIYKTSDIRTHLHTNHKDDMIPYVPKVEKKAY